jgi:hypothetical protein
LNSKSSGNPALSSGHIFSRSIFIFGSFASRRRVFFPPASSAAPPSPRPSPLGALASASSASGLGRDIPGLLFVRLDVGLPLLALQPVDLVAKRLPLAFQRCIFPRQPFNEVQQSFDNGPPCAVVYLRGVLVNGVYFSL